MQYYYFYYYYCRRRCRYCCYLYAYSGYSKVNMLYIFIKNRSCTYNVTLRCVHVTVDVVETGNYYVLRVCVCNVRQAECNTLAPYRHRWTDRFCSNFLTLSHTQHDLRKILTGYTTCVLLFSTNFFFSETFLTLRRTERDEIKNVFWNSRKVPLFCQILTKLEFYQQIFPKYSNIKFHENPSSESQVCPFEQTVESTDKMTKQWSIFAIL